MNKNEHLTKVDYVARREAREVARESARRKRRATVAAIALAGVLAVGGTIAWLTDETPEVTNVFTPASVPIAVVEEFNGETKSDVRIQNEGDIPAYIRAYAVVNWIDAEGNIAAEDPEGYSYSPDNIFAEAVGWAKGTDGFYYYLSPVDPNDKNPDTTSDMTGVLIKSITQDKDGEEYSLQVDIVAQSIQVDGFDSKGNRPIELAWGVDIEGGQLKAASIVA